MTLFQFDFTLAIDIYMYTHTTNLNRICYITNGKEITKEKTPTTAKLQDSRMACLVTTTAINLRTRVM